MRIILDKNVPVGTRAFLADHDVYTIGEMGWPNQLENGKLLDQAEQSGFDALVTSDQNIRYQQNLKGRKLALIVLGSNIWPMVLMHRSAIIAIVNAAMPGSYCFIEIPYPPKH